MAKINKSELANTRVDIEASASSALTRALSLQNKEIQERIVRLPKEEVDIGCIQETILAARACLELLSQQRSAAAQATEARLDANLVAEASLRKTRMIKVVSHYFETDPALGAEIADIRQGVGHADLASDLKRLATLYENQRVYAVIHRDPVFYVPDDSSRARTLAQMIYEQLDSSKQGTEKELSFKLAQAFTILHSAWGQVQRVVTFLFWGDVEQLALYPSLYSLGRSAHPTKSLGQKDPPK